MAVSKAKPKAKAKAAKPKAAAKAKTTKPKAATAKPKAAKKARPKAAPRRARVAEPKRATINIAELIDHPLVADLLSVGAMAAVAAIADHNVKTRTGEAESGSAKAVKAAGKAVASAIGKRLLTEVEAARASRKDKPAKS